ncbi:MAG: HTH domain-containing protein [Patescibacteria group bacterium]|nr:HTH domain-containing protein [Patescibacteria group bacterium]
MINTTSKILEYIRKNGQATGSELTNFFDISDRAIRKQLRKLLENDEIYKIGKPPKVYYLITEVKKVNQAIFNISDKIKKEISQKFLIITPSGEKKEGLDGFAYFCEKNNLPIEKTAVEYLKTVTKYDKYKKGGLIDGFSKLKYTFDQVYLDKVFYLDFYSIERFGKTRMGQLLLYAKQSQNKALMKEIIIEIKSSVDNVIKKYKIDGMGYIPPTVKRETQLMRVLEKGLREDTRKVRIAKVKTMVAVPQKTLNKLADRIENARNTIMVEENTSFNNILLIDNAVGSGATLNEVAKKIRDKKICKGKIIGLSLTGSFSGFDVISEV